MIVVDTNILLYLLIEQKWTVQAQSVRKADPEWKLPVLWRWEFQNALAVAVRRRVMEARTSAQVLDDALKLFAPAETEAPDPRCLAQALKRGLNAYDSAFLTLAEQLDLPLVTQDRALIEKGGGRVVDMQTFLSLQGRD